MSKNKRFYGFYKINDFLNKKAQRIKKDCSKENPLNSLFLPAGTACNQIPTIFKSKNGVARKWFSEPLCSIM